MILHHPTGSEREEEFRSQFQVEELSSLFFVGWEVVMVCQAASQTNFRALKHENGIAGCATIIVRVIACFQPLQDCQAEYFRHLLKPVIVLVEWEKIGDICFPSSNLIGNHPTQITWAPRFPLGSKILRIC
ncbi:hypothetical protein SADUNF_Sadunf02G0086000 [Salix dunnii]|uniref:Uncharacterized protein n=1 Tax=Salix dunnii TaxID=1413687 RepID=A0A835N6W4_9ROSI|nr:hypothetical protein SADUNF_Sadunf02G0086000 [Salix dunnii]